MADDNGEQRENGSGTGDAAPEPKRIPPVAPPAPPLPPPPMTGWGPQAEDPRVKAARTKTIVALVMAPLSLILCNVISIPAFVLALLALLELRHVQDPPSYCRALAIVALVLASLGLLVMLGTGALFLIMYLRQGNWP